MAGTRGPGADHDARRDELADAVLDVVADVGLADVSLAAVADRAGASVGRIQHYFGTKDALMTAAFERANARSAARIRGLVGHHDLADAPPDEVLRVVLDQLVPHDEATRAHLRVRQAFVARGLHDRDVAERLRADYAGLHGALADLLRRGAAAGSLRPVEDATITAVELVARAEGLADQVLLGVVEPGVALRLVRESVPRT